MRFWMSIIGELTLELKEGYKVSSFIMERRRPCKLTIGYVTHQPKDITSIAFL
ncbi:hypothetical protein QG37_01362 [Candidozyma auris]|nr:hypothetical protein QG37_01362 [[Candida] auris]